MRKSVLIATARNLIGVSLRRQAGSSHHPSGPGHQGQGLLRSTQAPHQSDRALLHISERLLLRLERSFKRRQDLLGVLVALTHGTGARDQQGGLTPAPSSRASRPSRSPNSGSPAATAAARGFHDQLRGYGIAGIEQPAGDAQRVVARAAGARLHRSGELAARLGGGDQPASMI